LPYTFNTATLIACQVRNWIACRGLIIYVQWFEVRGDYSFCWYWRNCWPSLFKFSFHNVHVNVSLKDEWLVTVIINNIVVQRCFDVGVMSSNTSGQSSKWKIFTPTWRSNPSKWKKTTTKQQQPFQERSRDLSSKRWFAFIECSR